MGELFILENFPTLKRYGYPLNIMKFLLKKKWSFMCNIKPLGEGVIKTNAIFIPPHTSPLF